MEHAKPPSPADSNEAHRDTLLKQYQLLVDTQLRYFDITLRITLFSYAVTGAILSYYLSKPAEGFMKYGLVFPVLMNCSFGISAFVAAARNRAAYDELKRVIALLNLGAFPDPRLLANILILFGAFFFIVTIGLIGLSLYRPFTVVPRGVIVY